MSCHGASVGVIIRHGDLGLFIKRRRGTPGWAFPAGHWERGEAYEKTGGRETWEEVAVKVEPDHLGQPVLTGWFEDRCSRGTPWHQWTVYEVQVPTLDFKRSEDETLDARWVPITEWSGMDLEPVWRLMLTQVGRI